MSKLARRLGRALEGLSNTPSTRPIAGVIMSAAKTLRTGRRHWISWDKHGWWKNQQADAVFFSPTLHSGTLEGLSDHVTEFWCPFVPLRQGDVIIDIGAGVGDHVLVFSRRVGSNGRVIAVEAHPETARCLQLTVDANGLSNTRVFSEAAWNKPALLTMSDADAHEGNAVGSGTIQVRARPVDEMLAPLNLERIDLIKLNVEGAEFEALEGMTETLSRAAGIVVSCHDFLATGPDDSRRTKARVVPFLEERGFTITQKVDAPYAFARDYVYGRRRL
jgi:FkbM family methyltransferase